MLEVIKDVAPWLVLFVLLAVHLVLGIYNRGTSPVVLAQNKWKREEFTPKQEEIFQEDQKKLRKSTFFLQGLAVVAAAVTLIFLSAHPMVLILLVMLAAVDFGRGLRSQ